MKLTLDKIKKLSIDELFNEFFLNGKFYDNYKYIFFNVDELKETSYEALEYFKNNYDGNVNVNNYFKSIFDKYIHKYLSSKIKSLSSCSYLIEYFFSSDKDFLNTFLKFDKFLQNYELEFSFEIICDILNNYSFIDESIQKLFKKYSAEKLVNNFFDLLSSNNLYSFVIAYAGVHDISVDTFGDDNNTYDSELLDSVSLLKKDISHRKVLTFDQEQVLFRRYKNGDMSARNIIIESNIRLVMRLANSKKSHAGTLSFEDLIQEGTLGLMKAIELYDFTLGLKFSTYAVYWINQKISRAIMDNGRTVRLPVHIFEGVNNFNRVRKELLEKLNRTPTVEEIAKEMQLPVSKVKSYYDKLEGIKSLNDRVKEDSESEFQDFYVEKDSVSVEDQVLNSMLPLEIEKLIDSSGLNDKEKGVLIHRYGLFGFESETLQEIGERYGVTRERIRQYESRALRKLRRNMITKDFAVYMDNPTLAVQNLKTLNGYGNKYKKFTDDYLEGRYSEFENVNIFGLLSYDDVSVVTDLVNSLKVKEREIVRKREGDNLDSFLASRLNSSEEQQYFEKIIPVLKSRLSKYLDRLYVSSEKRNGGRGMKKAKGICDLVGINDLELIRNAVLQLSEEQIKIIKERYGENLDEEVHFIDKESRHLFYFAIRRLRSMLFKEEKEEKKIKRLVTTYELIDCPSPEVFINLLNTLSEKQIGIIRKRDGENYDDPDMTRLVGNEKSYYYSVVNKLRAEILKMKGNNGKLDNSDNVLSEPQKLDVHISEEVIETPTTSDDCLPEPLLETPTTSDDSLPDILLETSSIDDNCPSDTPIQISSSKDDSYDNSVQVLKFLRTPSFMEIIETLSVKEAVIVLLRLGYVDEKYFSSDTIANFLDIPESEVRDATRKVLLLFKDKINDCVDSMISIVSKGDEQKRKLVKNDENGIDN